MLKKMILNLFDDGASANAGSAPAEGTANNQPQGEINKEVPDAEGQQLQPDKNSLFEDMIKGDYKDQFETRTQKIINERFKESKKSEKALQDQLSKANPIIETLSSRYGIDPSNVDGLLQALQNDNALYEDEAMQRGIPVEQLKEVKKIEAQNKQLLAEKQHQAQEEQSRQEFARIKGEAEQAKALYPNLNLANELANPQFVNLVHKGVDVGTAYRIIHDGEITANLMATAAHQAQQQTVNNIKAKGNSLPLEGGVTSTVPASDKPKDYMAMDRASFKEELDKARRGR